MNGKGWKGKVMNEQGCTRMESKNNDWKRMKEKE